MTLGQKARFTVGPEYAYGTEGIPGYPFCYSLINDKVWFTEELQSSKLISCSLNQTSIWNHTHYIWTVQEFIISLKFHAKKK